MSVCEYVCNFLKLSYVTRNTTGKMFVVSPTVPVKRFGRMGVYRREFIGVKIFTALPCGRCRWAREQCRCKKNIGKNISSAAVAAVDCVRMRGVRSAWVDGSFSVTRKSLSGMCALLNINYCYARDHFSIVVPLLPCDLFSSSTAFTLISISISYHMYQYNISTH